jgi:RNA polymerase sigma factor (sigma-70 family)
MVLSVCTRILGRRHDAEDAFQATFLVLARKANSIRPREMVGNWLHGVASKTAHRARSVLAKRQVREKQMNPILEVEAPAQDSWPEVQRVLDEELSRLSELHRIPILLCDLEGKSQKEAAQRLGLPEGTLSSRLSRGRAMLAKRLTRRGITLTGCALAAMLSRQRASACVPSALASSTLKAGRAFGAGQSVAGFVSSSVLTLTEGVLKAMLLTKLTNVTVALLLVACFSLGVCRQIPSATGQTQSVSNVEPQKAPPGRSPGKTKGPSPGFADMSPAARLQVMNQLTDSEKEFQAADRGDVIQSITTRGTLASANSGDISWQAPPSVKGAPQTATIRWIVDNGVHVRKGDVLVQLDDSTWQAQLKDKSKAHQLARAAIASAEAAVERGQLQNELEELTCEIALRAAELKLNKYAGNDPGEKELRKLEVKKANVAWQLAKSEGKARLSLAMADVQAKKEIADQELAQLKDIKDQISKCTIHAPKDGVVYYYIPEGPRGFDASQVLSPGRSVREAQIMLQMPDLDNMLANIRVHEALVSSVRGEGKDRSKWQAALIRVDAYPNRVLKGHVRFVEPVAAQDIYLTTNEKVYRTQVAIDKNQNGNMPRLLPGMSAEVTIEEVARRNAVVRAPATAVVQVGQEHYCYVKVGNEILKRQVTLGLRGSQCVEIRSGVQENDLLVRDVDGLIRRVNPFIGVRKE